MSSEQLQQHLNMHDDKLDLIQRSFSNLFVFTLKVQLQGRLNKFFNNFFNVIDQKHEGEEGAGKGSALEGDQADDPNLSDWKLQLRVQIKARYDSIVLAILSKTKLYLACLAVFYCFYRTF